MSGTEHRAAAFVALLCLAACGDSPNEASEVFEPTSGSDSGAVGTLGANDATSLTTMGMSMGGSDADDTVGVDDDTIGMPDDDDDDDDLDETTTGGDDDDDDLDETTTGSGDDDDDDDDDDKGSSDGGGLITCSPVLAEIKIDIMGDENGWQWVKLYNPCDGGLDLSDFELAWAGEDWLYASLTLEGELAPGDCFLFGGPQEGPANHDPIYDWEINLDPDLIEADKNPFGSAGGIALVPSGPVAIVDVPLDAVIYGSGNPNDLIDANGDTPDAYVADPNNNQVMRRNSQAETDWGLTNMAAPNECPAIPR